MSEFSLTPEEKKYLLSLARQTIILRADDKPSPETDFYSTTLKQTAGVFVTLNKNHQLRGCIGYVEGIKPLQNAVEEMALTAAFEDPRFDPVCSDEIKELQIEISILSPLNTISDIQQIEVGTNGLIIEKGLFKGLLLPQVAAEYGWDRVTFLEQTCLKAGLPKDAWKEESTKIQTFTAEIFSESDNL